MAADAMFGDMGGYKKTKTKNTEACRCCRLHRLSLFFECFGVPEVIRDALWPAFSMAVRGTQDSKHLSVSQALDIMLGDTSPQNMSPGPPKTYRRNQKSEEKK